MPHNILEKEPLYVAFVERLRETFPELRVETTRTLVRYSAASPVGRIVFAHCKHASRVSIGLMLRKFAPESAWFLPKLLWRQFRAAREGYFALVEDPQTGVDLCAAHYHDLVRREALRVVNFGAKQAVARYRAQEARYMEHWNRSVSWTD